MEIVFITAPICPKCVRIRRWLRKLKETHPEIVVKKYSIVSDNKKAKEYKIKTIPTLIVGDVMLGGLIKKEEYDAALEKLLKNIKS
ncbi:MAG: glutaredoxin family protein [Candidatus Heimdallarchaeota archaeon]